MNNICVLLVDDEVDFLSVMLKRLKKRNIQCYGFHSGEEALLFLNQHDVDVDVVILDVRMQFMSGIETLTVIKEKYPLIEVIMLTGHACLDVAKQGMAYGAFDYFMKPVDVDELMFKIQDAYQKKQLKQKKQKTD
ncbi:MAG: response regulator [Desulfobacterales bacterium]|nr:response regulator [Desulfobacterales bacterium]